MDRILLRNKTYDNTSGFTVTGTHVAKVVKVYDGDTCTVVMRPFGTRFYRFSVRMAGYDTPEIRGRSDLEETAGKFVRDRVSELILDRIVTCQCHGMDKYGRVLATIRRKGVDVSAWVLQNGWARAYDGGRRASWPLDALNNIK